MQTEADEPITKAHWDGVYGRSAQDGVSWYRQHLDTSLRFLQSVAGLGAAILDVGGGHSTLVDDLVQLGYRDVTVLDMSEVGLSRAKERLGDRAASATWLVGDITAAELPPNRYDVWHDRAVFHFLTDPEKRRAYLRQVGQALKPGGHLVIATFGPQGPLKCSGLEVCRYDAASVAAIFGSRFELTETLLEMHQTPFGTQQQFLYCHFKFS